MFIERIDRPKVALGSITIIENGSTRKLLIPLLSRHNTKRSRVRVTLSGNSTIELRIRPGSDRNKREAVLNEWYRAQLKEQVPPLIAEWEPRIGVEVSDWGIRRMKTRWGTCNTRAKRVWLNLDLAKKPPACLEYVLVHEMLHLVERHHNDRFHQLMNDLFPHWRLRKEELDNILSCF